MIAIAKPITTTKDTKNTPNTIAEADAKFLELMPGIRNYVQIAYSNRNRNATEDAEQSVLFYALTAIRSLAAKGRLEDAHPTILAGYGLRRHRIGRVGGVRENCRDVLAERCQHLRRTEVLHQGLCEHIADTFQSEATVVDGRYPVHRTVALRIDFFETWLAKQTPRDQQIIKDMAYGETTNDLARKYGVSAASISQYRRKYEKSWNEFINPKEDTDLIDELKELADKEADRTT